jgi:hypothetical protein
VERLVTELVRDFFSFDHQKTLIGSMQGVQSVDTRQEVMVGQNEEPISMLTVPANNVFRS